MKLLLNEEIDKQSWAMALKNSPFASPFQTPAFYDFLNLVPGYLAIAIAIEDKDVYCALAVIALQKEHGILSYFSRRGIIFGGPIINSNYPKALEILLDHIFFITKRKVIYIETRNFFNYKDQMEYFYQKGWKYIPSQNFHLDLSEKNLENILAGMDYNRRREIKISLQEGATYAECQNENDLRALYDILFELYKMRVKLPLPSFDFFKAFYTLGIGKVFIVKHNSIVIGGSFCPILSNRTIYTFYYCGVRNYHKKIFPTHLAVLAAIEYAVKNKIAFLDFMGAGRPGLEYGVRKYKKEFGGELVEHGRFLRVTQPFLYKLGSIGLKIFAKIR